MLIKILCRDRVKIKVFVSDEGYDLKTVSEKSWREWK